MKKFALRGLLILAAAVALCIFFSGTVRTLTTPKVRFAPVKMGKMEMETDLKGKVVFPEEEEIRLPVPEGMNLTVTRVHVVAGDQVKAGGTLISTKVTDREKNLDNLRKESAAAQKELRTLEKKTADYRLTRSEKSWQAAWEKEDEARSAARDARVNLYSALARAGMKMEDGKLPEEAGEDLKELYETWQAAESRAARAAEELAALDRYAIPEDTWNALQQKKEAGQKAERLEKQMLDLQVLANTTEKVTAPRAAYVTEVGVEKGSAVDGDTVILKLTAEGSSPVIRFDLSDVKQEVNPGTVISIEADSWSRPQVKVINTGLSLEGHPYADTEINRDVIYSLGSVSSMMKNEIKAKLSVRSQETTCLLPASAVRGSGDSRYVYVGKTENSTFGGNRMTVEKMNVTVLAESGSTVSVAEDLTSRKVLYMEDRTLTEDGAVMEYMKEAGT